MSLTLIRPNLEYASVVWDPYLIRNRNLLENIQKFACKVCLKNWQTEYQTEYDKMLDTLRIRRLETRRKVQRLCQLYKLIESVFT